MKPSRSEVLSTTHAIPAIRFEEQTLTSFSGLVVFQALFSKIDLKERLGRCFSHSTVSSIFGYHLIILLLVVHLLLGYRWLRDSRYYRDDPLVKRLLGLDRLPDVATLSRICSSRPTQRREARGPLRAIVLERLAILGLARITLDFDGSVQSTRGTPKARPWASTKRTRAPAATTRCSAPSPRPARCSTSCTARATSTTRTGPRVHSGLYSGGPRGPAGRAHRGPHGQRLLQRRDRHGPG